MVSEAAFAAIAARLGAPVPHVKAVAQVESSGETFWTIGGKQLPPVRPEAHWFGRLTGYRFNTTHPDLSCRSWNPALAATTKAGAWDQLTRMRGLDAEAADEATSWGGFQVMGFHWKQLRFNSVHGLVAAMDTTEGQLEVFAKFIEADRPLHADLVAGTWLDFERRYNGGGFNGAYAARLKAAVALFAGNPAATPRPMRRGDTGAAVARLQRALGIAADGAFGAITEAEVRTFQSQHGLVDDGVVGPMTCRELGI
jgi:peptidoglycan hydrolase-like protein with peptidoglycan-binding domain